MPLKKCITGIFGLLALGFTTQAGAQTEFAQLPSLVSAASAARVAAPNLGSVTAPADPARPGLDAGASIAGAGLFGLLVVSVVKRKRRRLP